MRPGELKGEKKWSIKTLKNSVFPKICLRRISQSISMYRDKLCQIGKPEAYLIKDMVLDLIMPRLYISCFDKVNFMDNSEMKTYRIVRFASIHKDVD